MNDNIGNGVNGYKDGIRLDLGYVQGNSVNEFYDSLLGKIIV